MQFRMEKVLDEMNACKKLCPQLVVRLRLRPAVRWSVFTERDKFRLGVEFLGDEVPVTHYTASGMSLPSHNSLACRTIRCFVEISENSL